ncbi:MAG: BNR-4 repeat-containing protein [Prolixibacteraceae bacterium]|jgi:hypothetical protein|nr:BNR-4 repeat-containing protein [Prolixibacteraceae bacterium]
MNTKSSNNYILIILIITATFISNIIEAQPVSSSNDNTQVLQSNYALSLPGGANGANSNMAISDLNFSALPVTIEMWYKPNGTQNPYATIIYNRNSVSGIQYDRWTDQSKIKGVWNNENNPPVPDHAPITGEWNHIALVVTSTEKIIYINGQFTTHSGNYTTSSFSGTTYIGWDEVIDDRTLAGEIDEVRIWTTARTAQQLEDNKLTRLNGNETGLKAYWNFDDQATNANDLTGNGFDGTINGGLYVNSTLFSSMEYIGFSEKLPVEIVTTTAASSVEGANFASFQQNAIMTYNGYQYVTYWNNTSRVCLARKKLPIGEWEEIVFTDYTVSPSRVADNHYTISMGICENNGTIHLSYDHHNDDLNYRISVPGLANSPDDFVWDASSFGSNRDFLVAGNRVVNVTYPRFISKPNGDLLFECRLGWSGDGDDFLWEYSADNGTWQYLGEYLNGTDVGENAYINGLHYDPSGRLHVSWVWRQTPDAQTNHDVYYAYSDDDGRTWNNSDGQQVGTLSNPMGMHSPGLKGWTVGTNRGLINQESQAVDNNGNIHILQSYIDEGVANTGFWNSRINNGKLRHIYRDNSGTWHSDVVGPSTRNRSEIAVDENNNVYVVAPNYRIYFASAADNWQTWEKFDISESAAAINEGLIDREALLNEQVLSFVFSHADNDGKIIVPYYLIDKTTPGTGKGLEINLFDNNWKNEILQKSDLVALTDSAINTNSETVQMRIEGVIETSCAEAYTLFFTSNGQASMWINDELVIETLQAETPEEHQTLLSLQPSHKYRIKIEGVFDANNVTAVLEWMSTCQQREIIPASSLYKDFNTHLSQSRDAGLSSLNIDKGTLDPTFNSDIRSYYLYLPNGTENININAVANNINASVEGDGLITLNEDGQGTLSITVTAENGINVKSYTIMYEVMSDNDATLKSLSLSTGTLRPAFHPDSTYYTLPVATGTTSVEITALTNNPNAFLSGDGLTDVSQGQNTAKIEVTAPDGETTMIYTIEITVSSLILNHSYTFDDGTANDFIGNAHGQINGGTVTDGVYHASNEGTDYITLPANEIALNTYLEFTLEAYVTAGNGQNNGNTMLSYFGGKTGNYGTNYFFTTLANGNKHRAAISCGNTSAPWNAETTVNGNPAIDDGKKHHLVAIASTTSITWYVDGQLIAEEPLAANNRIEYMGNELAYLCKGGYTSDPTWLGSIHDFNIYSGIMQPEIIAMNYSSFIAEPSDDASLAELNVSPVTLSPAFDTETTSYTLTVPAGTTSIEVHATTNEPNAEVDGTGIINIEESGQTIQITVTAEDGTIQNYTITVDIETGVDETMILKHIKVYPTVTSGNIVAECPWGDVYNIEIFDISGKTHHSGSFESSIQLQLEKEGLYFVKIHNKKVSKMHKVVLIK